MTSPLATAAAPFGRVLTAMVTPFTAEGQLDLEAAQTLANYLVERGNDGLVVSGTTGESPTTKAAEDGLLLEAVLDAVGDRATVVAGVGTNDTAQSVELAEQAARIGAHGLLIVTPYYNKPPQSGVIAHVETVAAAGDGVPVMLYDIPGRTGTELSLDTIRALDENPAVLAVKDAVGDLDRGTRILRDTGLAIYSGDDAVNLAWLTGGAAGLVSVVGHVAGVQYARMVKAVDAGDLETARELNAQVEPAVRGLMTITQGAIASKAALELQGVLTNRHVRLPLVPATDDEVKAIEAHLVEADLVEAR